MTLAVAEPTYRDAEHAAINAMFAQALAPDAVTLAATPAHWAALAASADGPLPPHEPIDVLAPGGVTLRRMRAQWLTLTKLVTRHRVTSLVLLSAGPETLFVARTLVARYPDLIIHAVMHGNMADLAGWRSHDPRRRWIDLRAGLHWARHARIRLVVLEHYIAGAVRAGGPGWHGLAHPLLVWPLPPLASEAPQPTPWQPGPRLRITVPGVANREKGFDDVLTLAAGAPQHDWYVTGRLGTEYRDGPPPMPAASGRLPRPAYLAALRRADYAILMQRPEYEMTASGSFLDCATSRVPLIGLQTPALSALAIGHGPLGYLLPTINDVQALLASDTLRDRAAYAGFQANLSALHQSRTVGHLRPLMLQTLAV